ncbi:MAG TPA: gamma-glutamyltransferase [Pyrinomonadaceae bacterium]|jgi:gamma-glutamyltranspeptidase/glutathione hydrolase|nr:gamma-glutamyltransferase [Pyrinomonadaceae bacterium]
MNNLKKITAVFLLLQFGLLTTLPARAASREPVRGKHAMVASNHRLASRAGIDVIKRGGNAVDAAVAVALALAVVYPEAGNLGGGGFMLIRFKDGRTTSIDYREMAPAAATHDIFVDGSGSLIKGEGSSTEGYRASGVPGTPAGLEMAFKKYGSKKLTWAQLVEPARKLAANGYEQSYRLAELLKSYEERLSAYDESKRVFLRGGSYYEEGDIFKQPELAATLARIQKFGAKDFYQGVTAKLIADDMKAHKGLITLEDLKNYVAKERVPVQGSYRGFPVISMAPPSSGGIALLETLNILEGYDLKSMGWNSAQKYHLLTEALRRSFADRAEFLGDPDFANIPTAKLIDKKYAETRRASIDLTKATSSAQIGHGEPFGKESMETTHFTVVDTQGNVVTNTYTINDLYGSGVTIKGAGFLMNDEMDDFAARPGKPNMYGLIQGENNSVMPKRRPLSAMTPTIVLRKDGSFWFALGGRGGPRIITAVIQSVINVIDHEMNIQQAIDAPRIHHQWYPDEIYWENFGFSNDTRSILENMGHKFRKEPLALASTTAIMVDEKGVRLGAVDARADGEAVGY